MAEAKLAPNLPDWMVEHANLYLASLDFRRRQQKLVQSNRCKTGPGKAVAGRPVASVA